jgi:WD40 repeat protein
LHTPDGHTGTIHAIAISADDRLLATGGEDSIIRIWDLQTGAQQMEIAAGNGWIMSLAFRADGRELVSAEWNLKDLPRSTIRVWDVETGTERGRIAGDLMSPTGLALAPDGTWAAVSDGGHGRVGLWDLDTRAARHFFGGFPTGPQCVALSPDGTLLLAGYNARRQEEGKWNDPQNTVVRFWDAATGRLIHEFDGHSGPILSVEFSSDGRYALSLASDQHDSAGQFVESSDHTVRIWDLKTRDEVARFLVDRANVARWLPGRRSICTGVRIWDLPIDTSRNEEQGE